MPLQSLYYILIAMTIQQIYDLGLEMAMKNDPRGAAHVKKILADRKKAFDKMTDKEKKFFDEVTLKNPYADSRILFGDPKRPVKRLMAGIDADGSEILIADRLTEKGTKIDLVITHHPSGHALASLHDVMALQTDVYAGVGVPVNVAHALMEERMSMVRRRFAPLNHNQAVDAARLLQIPLVAMHTFWDNISDHFMSDYIGKKQFETVGEIYEHLMELPEYVESTKGKAGPQIVSGSKNSRAGKIVVFFTGGTNPSKEMYMEWAKAGIGTVIDMHIPEEALTELKKLHVNVIDTGHMASDSIGANIFLDALEKQGVEVIPCSGLVRIKRNK